MEYLIVSIVLFVLSIILLSITAYLYNENRKIKKTPLEVLGEGAAIIKDISTHGYAVVRLDPDNIMYRTR